MKRGGFTLIELLVVIAIIAILAAILFPVFVSARESAKSSTCLAHVKELGQATILYAADSSDALPTLLRPNGTAGENWDLKIYKYAKNQKMFQCPIVTFEKSMSSFGFNFKLGYANYVGQQTPVQAARLSSIKSSSKVVLLCDCQTENWRRPIGYGNAVWCFYDDTQDTYKYRTGLRHHGGDNFCFADGHAKWMEIETVKNEASPTNPIIYTWRNASFEPNY